jgi:hypothetical protein
MATAEQVIDLAGDDALQSHWFLRFPTGIPGAGFTADIHLRIVEDFKLPKKAIVTEDIFYKGQRITKVGATEESDKNFSLKVRMDSNWLVYDRFNEWLRSVYDPEAGARGKDSDSQTSMQVLALGRGQSETIGIAPKIFIFEKVQLFNMDNIEFNHTSGEPIVVQLDFKFLRFREESNALAITI